MHFVDLFTEENEYWSFYDSRKQLFDNLADKRGFDPTIPDNWYKISLDDIITEPVSIFVIINNQRLILVFRRELQKYWAIITLVFLKL